MHGDQPLDGTIAGIFGRSNTYLPCRVDCLNFLAGVFIGRLKEVIFCFWFNTKSSELNILYGTIYLFHLFYAEGMVKC